MAVASAWAKPGSWALAAEEQDNLPPPPPPIVPAADFPDLATAANTKVPKKKKAQPVSLAAFNTGKFVPSSSRGPAPDALLTLPTGPRERTEEELGGARWGNVGSRGSGGSDELRRGGSGADDYGPSRADEADDWGAKKQPMERRDRMGGFGGGGDSSRADDVDDWVSTKRTAAPSSLLPVERRERSSAFGSESTGRADDSNSWVSNKSYSAPPPAPADGRRGGSVWGFNRDGAQDSDSWARRREEVSSGSGGNSGGARPRLVLQKRTLPVAAVVPDVEKNEDDKKDDDNKAEDEAEDKGESQLKSRSSSNPFGAARPREEVLAAKGENLTKEDKEEEKLVIQPKVRSSNPFGAARPREEVLAAKGEDWRKIDEKLDAMKMREAPPERRSSEMRGSPIPGEENGNAEVPDSRADSAWKKPAAVEAAGQPEQGSEATEETAPAN